MLLCDYCKGNGVRKECVTGIIAYTCILCGSTNTKYTTRNAISKHPNQWRVIRKALIDIKTLINPNKIYTSKKLEHLTGCSYGYINEALYKGVIEAKKIKIKGYWEWRVTGKSLLKFANKG